MEQAVMATKSGVNNLQYLLLMALGALALVLVAFNIATAFANQGLRKEVGERQQYINQSVQLARFNNQLVQGLATLSAQTSDAQLKAVLNKHGVDFTVKPREQAASSPAAAPTEAPVTKAPVENGEEQ
jgi:hypothetical protein